MLTSVFAVRDLQYSHLDSVLSEKEITGTVLVDAGSISRVVINPKGTVASDGRGKTFCSQ